MTINGNMKFFDTNKIDDYQSFDFTSASLTTKSYLYDNNLNTKIISIGSNDVTPEIFTITFDSAVSADRICIFGHNIKSGNLQYSDDNKASWKDFSTPIAWSGNSITNNYYEFNEVSNITDIRLTMNTTIVANDQKKVAQLRLFNELGIVEKNPVLFDHYYEDKSVTRDTSSGGNLHIDNSGLKDKFRVSIRFNDANVNDMTLFRALKNKNDSFYIYPCGGDLSHPGINQEGWRINDMYLVNFISKFRPSIREVLGIGTDITIEFWEVA